MATSTDQFVHLDILKHHNVRATLVSMKSPTIVHCEKKADSA